MLIEILKFAHVLLALGLLGLTSCCFIAGGSKHYPILSVLNNILLYLSFFALLTGTLLVHSKHYTFHTAWIQAAYFFLTFFIFIISLLILKKNNLPRWLYPGVYLFLIILLIIIMHDAVRKVAF
ncbi:MAG: hypothetical protein K0S27_186 [Gammaproteobacteria bacterium]|jgi:uncharacterized membrane protein YozB (DUF420 family)|nr:hypothetical protein [Gammaproteobacteria bacterium]